MDETEQKIINLIEQNKTGIIRFAEDIMKHPELGFKENRTAGKVAELFNFLHLESKKGLALTGVKSRLKGAKSGPTVAIIAELDAVKCPTHPHADKNNGAAHCCGHHAQIAAMIGAAIALSDPDIVKELDGDVVFFAVPSEEYGEIEFKNTLREKGLVEFLSGKPELIKLGEFDDIDIALSYHVPFGSEKTKITVGGGSSLGFISKLVRYIGRPAHAAAAPYDGVNALNAATLGLSALNFQRETFHDNDHVRVHPIVTKGGDLVNVVPGETTIELLVRAGNLNAVTDANHKADRAFKAGAMAVGAKVEITDLPGYLPRVPEQGGSPFLQAAEKIADKKDIRVVPRGEDVLFSTDLGDLSHIMPVFGFTTGGVSGEPHSAEFTIFDKENIYITPAEMMALTAYHLLKAGAKEANSIKSGFKPKLTKQEYLEFMRESAAKKFFDFTDE